MIKLFHMTLSMFALLMTTNVYPALFEGAIVKVYSNGKLVEKYEAKPGGKFVGTCYVFDSNSELHKKTITVCGTFVVEEKR